MSEPFTGEIRMFAGNFAPQGWAFCDGQLLAVSQNDALFSLLGTIYGGDGRTTFGLPDLRGRIPIHQGSGPGLTPRQLGAKSGSEKVTLTAAQLPTHSHTWQASSGAATQDSPVGAGLASPTANVYKSSPSSLTPMKPDMVAASGGSAQHTNLMPALCVHFIISLFGIYPSRQ
jgi:microcystin-dependent protein